MGITSGINNIVRGLGTGQGMGFLGLFSSTRSGDSLITAFLTILRLTGAGGVVLGNSVRSVRIDVSRRNRDIRG